MTERIMVTVCALVLGVLFPALFNRWISKGDDIDE